MAMRWNQARARCSGGLSLRETLRAGRMHRGGEGRKRPAAANGACAPMALAVTLPEGPGEFGAVGSPDPWQGEDFEQGVESASVAPGTGGKRGGRTFGLRGPQQQEA